MSEELKKLKLYGFDHNDRLHFFILESNKNFFPLFAKFLMTYDGPYAGYYTECEKWSENPPENIKEFNDKSHNVFVHGKLIMKILFASERIVLIFFDEDKDNLARALAHDVVDFKSLKENKLSKEDLG